MLNKKIPVRKKRISSGYLRERSSLKLIMKYIRNRVVFAGKSTFEVRNSRRFPIFSETGVVFAKEQNCLLPDAIFPQTGHHPISFFICSNEAALAGIYFLSRMIYEFFHFPYPLSK
ncbi:predicted protein [Methanosarcina acetivorans C2A]|uniref:Uncharacterized protein n=1 Tax=Methanosarcina acetivorans (strain ATCC 35395 / DSM 2834 / JCM 12185 / C2A) TaxID=188937 RepID=Q8THL9_METAC|nr:predicted protein [Methanosarcina acetivorans C2A]